MLLFFFLPKPSLIAAGNGGCGRCAVTSAASRMPSASSGEEERAGSAEGAWDSAMDCASAM